MKRLGVLLTAIMLLASSAFGTELIQEAPGDGPGIIDSGVPREEIWVTSKLWPSEYGAGVTEKAIDDMLEILPQIMQIECHPFAQRLETRALVDQYGMQVECWYPLGHADDRLLNDEVLSSIAKAHDKSVVQVILRWHMQEGFCAVPGSTNPDHIQENINIFDFELSDEEMEEIRAIDKGESGRYFNINYQQMGGFFTTLNE